MCKVKRFRVRLIESRVTVEGQEADTFGIEITGEEGCARVEDVTPDRETAERLCALFARERLSPLHLTDAVEDFLGGAFDRDV